MNFINNYSNVVADELVEIVSTVVLVVAVVPQSPPLDLKPIPLFDEPRARGIHLFLVREV